MSCYHKLKMAGVVKIITYMYIYFIGIRQKFRVSDLDIVY